jgi:hypothetical protein
MFAKKLVIDNNTYSYDLLGSMPFQMPVENAFNIYRIDPPSTSDIDKTMLLAILNHLDGNKDLKASL